MGATRYARGSNNIPYFQTRFLDIDHVHVTNRGIVGYISLISFNRPAVSVVEAPAFQVAQVWKIIARGAMSKGVTINNISAKTVSLQNMEQT